MSSKGKGKGKEVASSGKRKREDKADRNRSVLQFFEDEAGEADDLDTDLSDFDDDELFAEYYDELKDGNEPSKSQSAPLLPKEEALSDGELERVLEERYRSGSGYVRYAEDASDTRKVDRDYIAPPAVESPVWKVKCKVSREKQTVFCLMQKYLNLKLLGTKLPLISVFYVEHVKGFIFVESAQKYEVMEACRQLPDVYYSMVSQVPRNEITHLLSSKKKQVEVPVGAWARLRGGKYKGDLAQVVYVNDSRRSATVKLIPRVDLQAMAMKYGGGSSTKKPAIPAPRLLCSAELEEFRPLIQFKHDRETGLTFEIFDGMMLKNGYLFKKVPIDSLILWDVNPSREEVQKFTSPTSNESDHSEFLLQIYGEKKKEPMMVRKGGKGEASSSSSVHDSFEVHDLVLFGKREFGMVVSVEKEDTCKVLYLGSEGSAVISLAQKELKNLHLDKKFHALDQRMKTIYVNDTIRICDEPLKGREGVVKQIYRGILFIYDQNDLDDNAYFCSRSQSTERLKHSVDSSLGKDGIVGSSQCEDFPSSPKSPLSLQKPWESGDGGRDFKPRDETGTFSVGQSLRFRIGPLKGYRCRVLAVRRSDVTVKLDSQQKVLTVKSDHLVEVNGKNFATSTSDDVGLDSSKPFGFLGTEGASNDWLAGSAHSDGGGTNDQSSSWTAFPSSGHLRPWGSSNADALGPAEAGAGWGQPRSIQNSSWGASTDEGASGGGVHVAGSSEWSKTNCGGSSGAWNSWKSSDGDHIAEEATGQGHQNEGWKKSSFDGSSNAWGNVKSNDRDHTAKEEGTGEGHHSGGWGKRSSFDGSSSAWGKGKSTDEVSHPSEWGSKSAHASEKQWSSGLSGSSGWNAPAHDSMCDAWDKSGSLAEENSEAGGWNKCSKEDDKVGRDTSRGSWGTGNLGWKASEPAPDSQSGGWGCSKGILGSADNDRNAGGSPTETGVKPASGWSSGSSAGWGQHKGKGAVDATPSWGGQDASNSEVKLTDNTSGNWGKYSSSSEKKGWNSSSSGGGENQCGGWGNGGGGWGKSQGDDTSTQVGSWRQSNFGEDGGFSGRSRGDFGGRRGGGEFGGRRGGGEFRGRGRGRYQGGDNDQFGRGRGRGRSFGRGQSWNQGSSEDNTPSWSSSYGGDEKTYQGGHDCGKQWSSKGGGGGWQNSSGGQDNDMDTVQWGAGKKAEGGGSGSWGSGRLSGGWGQKDKAGDDGGGSMDKGMDGGGSKRGDSSGGGGWGLKDEPQGGDARWGNSSGGKVDDGGWGSKDRGSGTGGWGNNSNTGQRPSAGDGKDDNDGGWGNKRGSTQGRSSGGWGKGGSGEGGSVGGSGKGGSGGGWGKDAGGSGGGRWGKGGSEGSSGGGWGKDAGGSGGGGWGKDAGGSGGDDVRGKDGGDSGGGGWGNGSSAEGCKAGSEGGSSRWGKDDGDGGGGGWGNGSSAEGHKAGSEEGSGGWGNGSSAEGHKASSEEGSGGWGKDGGRTSGGGGGGWSKSGGGGWGKSGGW